MAGSVSGENTAVAVIDRRTVTAVVTDGSSTSTAILMDTLSPVSKVLGNSGTGIGALVVAHAFPLSGGGVGSDSLVSSVVLSGYSVGYLHGYTGGILASLTDSGVGSGALTITVVVSLFQPGSSSGSMVSGPFPTLGDSSNETGSLATSRTLQVVGLSSALTGLVSGGQYTATVLAYDAAGNRSATSTPLVFTTT